MSSYMTLALYIGVGLLGGLGGARLKLPAGAMVGALIAVIAVKLILKSEWEAPKGFGFFLQVLLGVLVGAGFHPSMLQTFHKLIVPVVLSSVVLVGTGLLLAVIFHKLGLLDLSTGYLGTSPGAMTVLVVLALDSGVNTVVVTCFHLFRVIFVVLTAPLLLKWISG
ncbi:AbrB family transcriptional regulator [bacterium]|nr:AbrB family transcriptional regulator [bacterium]